MPPRARVPVFGLGVFLGAFLLFLVQPLVARQILPWFGGGPAVWSTCLLFFQIALVAGYAYAHLTRRLGLARQVRLHGLLLAVATLTLPIGASAAWKPPDGEDLVGRVLWLLTLTVGPAFLLVAATAPLLQDWAAIARASARPYRLYVVSNAGSLLALVAYPLIVEPFTGLRAQAIGWSAGFVVFAGVCAWCGWLAMHDARAAGPAAAPPIGAPATAALPDHRPVPVTDRALWLIQPAVGAGLLLATTSQLSQDVAAVPLIWIVPLAIYLVSYIVAFAGGYRRGIWGTVLALGVAGTLAIVHQQTTWSLQAQAAVLLTAFAAACLVCHGELARLQPPVRHLTAYYLAMSAGGALGGAFVALVAPFVFTDFFELPLLLLASVAVVAGAAVRDYRGRHRGDVATLVSAGVTAAFAVAVIVILAGSDVPNEIARQRSIYGVMRIVQDPPQSAMATRRLYHGRILHGLQFLAPSLQMRPTSYYSEDSGLALAITRHPKRVAGQPMTIGAVGLGTGTIAAWGRAGDTVRFFEIDEAVVDVAHTWFTFLDRTPAEVEIRMGDARLSLEREAAAPEGRHVYDVLALDAFSGDAIPVHLLTREAFAIYTQVLKEDGVLAVHISNRYLDLRPVVYGAADEVGWQVIRAVRRSEAVTRTTSSDWLLVTRNPALLTEFEGAARRDTTAPAPIVWTDAYSSLLRILK